MNEYKMGRSAKKWRPVTESKDETDLTVRELTGDDRSLLDIHWEKILPVTNIALTWRKKKVGTTKNNLVLQNRKGERADAGW